jgi:hypothetical protein
MLIWTIKTAIISFLFIFLVHHLILFLKSTLTVPKIKDLVNSPHHKYQHIFDILSKPQHNNQSYTAIELLPPSTESLIPSNGDHLLSPISDINISMKDELKSFLKGQLANNS